jgi:hypothetical protein
MRRLTTLALSVVGPSIPVGETVEVRLATGTTLCTVTERSQAPDGTIATRVRWQDGSEEVQRFVPTPTARS